MLKIFLTNKYDKNIALIEGNKHYTFFELKKLVAGEMKILKTKKENIVISTDNNFYFIIQFLASIFLNKNIYLISDKTKINNIDFDFDFADEISYSEDENYIFQNIDIDNLVINFFTSGSTSKPKIIKKTLFNLIQEALDIEKEFNLKNKDLQVISTTTMCHLFGMTFHLMFPLINGLIINTNKISYPENIDINNSILVSTPSFLGTVLKYDASFKISPKYIISAGSKLDNNIFEYFEKKSKVIEIYGSTETGVIAYRTHYNNDFTLFKNVTIKTNNRGIEVISDYSFEKTCKINDIVEVKGNNLKIKNRTDRLFKIQDKRISAEELENKLKTNKFITNCYILKTDDKLACLCALSDLGKDFIVKYGVVELTKNLKKYLSDYSEIIPQKWKYIDEIPLNRLGKTNKKLIEHIFSVNLSLPVILDRKMSSNYIIYKIFFYNQCNFFKGHFPNFQILPGVVQLYLAKEFANQHFDLKLNMGQWKRIKFSNIIKADSIVELKLEKTDKQVAFEYSKNSIKYSSGVFLCENIFEKALKEGVL